MCRLLLRESEGGMDGNELSLLLVLLRDLRKGNGSWHVDGGVRLVALEILLQLHHSLSSAALSSSSASFDEERNKEGDDSED